MAKEPQTIEELDAAILANSQKRDALNAEAAELHRLRDELLRGGRVDAMLAGLSDEDREALRIQLTTV